MPDGRGAAHGAGQSDQRIELRARDPDTGMFTEDRTCADCKLCADNEFVFAACSDESDTICQRCSSCTGTDTMEAACTALSDTVCAPAEPVPDHVGGTVLCAPTACPVLAQRLFQSH